MLRTKVPNDIRKYKTKLAGPFTLKQLITVTGLIILDNVFAPRQRRVSLPVEKKYPVKPLSKKELKEHPEYHAYK